MAYLSKSMFEKIYIRNVIINEKVREKKQNFAKVWAQGWV